LRVYTRARITPIDHNLRGFGRNRRKEIAVSRAQLALGYYARQYKEVNDLSSITVKAMRVEPQPCWRGRVSENTGRTL
jgi:hypothetical protein